MVFMDQYEMYIKVVELKSFSEAAKALNRTPSAISKQIHLLEESLGVQLFIRTTRALTITSAGQLYYERCSDISKKIENAKTELKDFANEPAGTLNVTWPNFLSSSSIIRALGGFTKAYPNIKLNVEVTNEYLDLLQSNIDFAFRSTSDAQLKDSNLIAIKLSYIQPILCASSELLRQNGYPKTMTEFLSLPQVIPTYFSFMQGFKKAFPGMKDFDESKHHKASDVMALYNMIKAGFGVGCIARHIVERDIQEGNIIDLTGEMLPKFPMYLIFPKLNYTPKINRYFIDYLKNQFSTT